MKTKKIALSMLLFGTAVIGSTFAYNGNYGGKDGQHSDSTKFQAIQDALSTKNYESWKTLMAGKPILSIVNTQEKFELYVQFRNALQKGDTTTANSLSQQLGLEDKPHGIGSGSHEGHGIGLGSGNRHEDSAQFQAIQVALTTHNYESWKTLMSGKGIVSKIDTQEKFELYTQLRDAADKGDKTTVETLTQKLGLDTPKMDGTGVRKGLKRGFQKVATK